MKIAVYAAASAAVLAALAAAQPAAAQDAEIRNAVARVIVIPEDRSDIAVEITQGSADLPQLTVERRGGKVRIDGGLGRRRSMLQFTSDSIRQCSNGRATWMSSRAAASMARSAAARAQSIWGPEVAATGRWRMSMAASRSGSADRAR